MRRLGQVEGGKRRGSDRRIGCKQFEVETVCAASASDDDASCLSPPDHPSLFKLTSPRLFNLRRKGGEEV